MSDHSTIEWTETTWNPVTGCDRVSEGCDHCYAQTLAKRLKAMGNPRYQIDGDPRTSGPGFGVTMHADKVEDPLHWRRPRVVFVNSMSDLFHDRVTDYFRASVFAVMAATPQHTYQVLTKRPGPMASWFAHADSNAIWADARARGGRHIGPGPWPLPNVWIGTSVENQHWTDIRVPQLLRIPAVVRFLSCEPLLGPVDLSSWIGDRSALQWVIVGGESGKSFRPFDPAWARGLRDQCLKADVAFFFKQHGGFTPKAGGRDLDGRTWDDMPILERAGGG